MIKRAISFILFISITSVAIAQTHQVEDVKFEDNEDALEYFKKTESNHLTLYSAMARNSTANELKSMRYEFKKEGENLEFIQFMGERSNSLTLEKSDDETFHRDMGRQSITVRFDGKEPVIFIDTHVPLNESENHKETYDKLIAEYGENIRAYRTELELKQITQEDIANELHIEKAFEVTDVSVKSDEKVLDFAEEFIDLKLYNNYHTYSQSVLDRTFKDMKYKISIDGSRASIRAGAMSFSSTLNKIEENRYRFETGRAYYDFILSSGDTGSFDVVRIEHAEFFPPNEEYLKSAEYKDLKEEYGENIPYFTVVKEVKEIPVE